MIDKQPNREAESQAADWDARLRSPACSAEERDSFSAWLASDPTHREAFGRLQSALGLLRAGQEHPQLRALREAASLMERRKRAKRRSFQGAGVAAALLITLGGGYWVLRGGGSRLDPEGGQALTKTGVQREGEWRTGAGERRTVVLSDGSSATLNASSRIQVDAFDQERRVRLLAGQAFFRVSKDPARPFIVAAASRTITALGTAFDVRLEEDQVEVTLLEGRVAVRNLKAPTAQPPVELKPGEQLLTSDQLPSRVRTVNAAQESAWSQGQIVFVDESLPEAVAQMNRYSAEQVLAGPELSHYRVNGMFLAGNQEVFVTALTSYFPLEAVRDSENHVVLKVRTRPSH